MLTARHQLISNTLDSVAIHGVAGDFNGQGNIGGGRLDQFQASLIYPVTWPPLSGLTIQGTAFVHLQQSDRSPDAFPAVHFGHVLPWKGNIALTQDLPDWHARLGASWTWPNGSNLWRFNEYDLMDIKDPETEVFVEYKPDARMADPRLRQECAGPI